jgi:NADH-quinone oxidoreductase chain G
MVNVFVNNIKVSVEPNTSVLKACEALKIEIPRFCYHKKLSIAGNCRMCLVEIEKSPKPVVSCAMPVMENMKIFTDTPLVKKAREGVLEFLLLNHPLDCPVCDQGGECELQDQAMVFGSDQSRFYDLKRGVHDKKLGPLIKTIMTRCIHCTRCVRFATEIAGVEDLGTTIRGTETEIGTYIEKIFKSELSGNVIDLCPVGALTSKPYAFKARPWELKTEISVDTSDGLVSNVKLDFKSNEIVRITPNYPNYVDYDENYRIKPDEHPFVDEWISDKARFCYDGLQSKNYQEKNWLTQSLNEVENKLKVIHESTDTNLDMMVNGLNSRFVRFNDTESLRLSENHKFENGKKSERFFLPFSVSNVTENFLRNSNIHSISNFLDLHFSTLDNKITNFNFFIDEEMDYNTLVFYNLLASKLKTKLVTLKLSHFKKVHFNGISVEIFTKFAKTVSLNNISLDESFFNCPNNQKEGLSVPSSLVSRQRTNVSMSDLEKSDLCLLIGTNPRYEGSLYNIHLRKRFLSGGFKIASIGSPVELTYPICHLGIGTQTLQLLAEGNHPFFDEMVAAKNPMILLGSGLLTKKDYSLIEALSLHLSSKTGVISTNKDAWLGFGILQSKPNKLGEIALGLTPLNEIKMKDGKANEINFVLSSDKIKVTSLINRLKSRMEFRGSTSFSSNLIPVSIKPYLERKNFSFLNTEGKLKPFKKVLNFSVNDKILIDPIKLILSIQKSTLLNFETLYSNYYNNFSSYMNKKVSFNLREVDNWIKNHYLKCFPGNIMPKDSDLNTLNINNINSTYLWKAHSDRGLSYNALIDDFYLTDTIRRSSSRMLHCSALHRSRVTNFLNF